MCVGNYDLMSFTVMNNDIMCDLSYDKHLPHNYNVHIWQTQPQRYDQSCLTKADTDNLSLPLSLYGFLVNPLDWVQQGVKRATWPFWGLLISRSLHLNVYTCANSSLI